jgi:TonB family protein
MYGLITPASDVIAPGVAELAANAQTDLDLHLSIEPTAFDLRVCRDCKVGDYKLVELIRTEAIQARDEQSAAILAAAEPEEGWNAFNEQLLSYSPPLKGTRLQGAVVIDGTITPDGVVANLEVSSSPEIRLTEAALDLLRAQRWRPARVRAMPVESPLHATVEFTIRGF